MLRAEHQLSQWEVAERLGVGQSTYCLIETGRRVASRQERRQLARIFRTTPEAIFDIGSPAPPIPDDDATARTA